MNQSTLPEDHSEIRASHRKVMVTGATGFVGGALMTRLCQVGRFGVKAAVRIGSNALPVGVEQSVLGDFTPDTDWLTVLKGVDVVVHLAARVHVMNDKAADPLLEFRKANVEVTRRLALHAVEAGVRRFVFVSSAKVNGEGYFSGENGKSDGKERSLNCGSRIYRESDPAAPQDAYGVSKNEAEVLLRNISEETGMEVVIIRPPLVYGPGVRANFLSLIRVISKGIPLPLGAIKNRRSLVSVDNLVDFIITCMEHPSAANETFLVSDGEDLSTTDLVRRIARALGRPARLIPIPAFILRLGASLVGRQAALQRLLGSLQVDITKARTLLGWRPPHGVEASLARTVRSLRIGR